MSAHLDTTNLSAEDFELLTFLLEDEGNAAATAQQIPKRQGAGEGPLSFAQQRLWFLDQLESGSSAYNISLALRLIGGLNIAAFEQALNEIIRRHDVLRTKFKAVDGEPVQVIDEFKISALPIMTLADLSATAREAEVQRLVSEEAQQPFDLANGPVLRRRLLKLNATEHVFLLTMHHIAADGWSLEILFRELAQLYPVFCKGHASRLRELPIQYADFSFWQRQWLTGETLESQLAYWRRQLAEAPPILELPADRPRPAAQTFAGAIELFRLSSELTAALQKLSQQQRVTMFMTLLAAFKTLLHRYTGQEDIVVGSPIANRNRAEIEELIGFFANTLVLRTNLAGNPTFQELLARVNEVALEAYAHQDVPFEKLVEDLQPQRDLSVSPLFQVLFIYQNVPNRDFTLPGLQCRFVESYSGTAKFDLTLTLSNHPEPAEGDGLIGAIEYNTNLFDAATIRRMAGHFERLLQNIVANPEQRLADLALLPDSEKRQMLAWNATQKEYHRDVCFHQRFESQAEKTPDSIALIVRPSAHDGVFENQYLTYRELNRRANQLAQHLRKLNVGPDVLVGICLERSPEMVVALLGVLKAGAAYVPLDPAYPPERIVLVLEDAKVPVLLTTRLTIVNYQLSIINCQLICLDTDWDSIAAESDTDLRAPIDPENLAYAIYTSGSTGKPKGVAIPHRALANFLNSMRQAPGISAQDKLLAVTTISFDIAGLELYLPLTVGASVVLVSREVAIDSRQLMTALENSGATVMQATPATWRMLIETGWQGRHGLKILCGGEALPRELANQLLDCCAELWNMYGPTETTIWSTVNQINERNDVISIGGPIDNTQIYLLDRHLQIVPIGVHGELHIGGDGLARGYLNRPELTAEKFVPNGLMPNGLMPNDLVTNDLTTRLYNTGDLARHLPDGKIDCLGRLDHQVKIRGFRIELGEIEELCGRHPAIDQVVVVAREDSPNNKRLVAYLIASSEPAPAVSELREFLREKLPDYMIPAAFVFLSHEIGMPLTPNGKVDRRALPAPEQAAFMAEEKYMAPQNAVEELLADIWLEVLGLTKVGVNDNFFELGGHSLLAVRLFMEIERSFQRSLPLASIFKAPTIKQLADMISGANLLPTYGCLVTLQEQGDKPPLFCVSGLAGHTFNFRQLARHLGNDQPVYGLQYSGLDGQEEPLSSIEDIAAEFIRHIREVQPAGPYHFCGLCFGGLVVYEMAQQLIRNGESIAMLCLVDAFAPGGVQEPEWRQPIVLQADNLWQLETAERRDNGVAHLQSEAEISSNGHHHHETRGSSLAEWIENVRRANDQAMYRYQPQPYPGQVILFKPTKRGEGWNDLIIDPLHGWRSLARGGVEVYEIKGYHNNMFREPKVQRLAKKIRAYL